MRQKDYLVSAIVSVYNCERFIRGCLEDLEQQTIADKLEIVVINSGSQQNEETIIKEFQAKYDNIVYIKTEDRETIYGAWNRGIKASSGKYITNANTDDRHRKDAIEIMANELENNKDIALVYYDFIITETENETFEKYTSTAYLKLAEFDQYKLLQGGLIGHQPMWRKKLHEEFGYFEERLKVAGDHEFWLRISEKYKFKHIENYLGLYLKSKDSAEYRNLDVTISEVASVRNKYMHRIAHDKNKVREIKKRQYQDFFVAGYKYFQKKQFCLARKMLFRSIAYDWCNFKSYKVLMLSFLSPTVVKILKSLCQR